MRTPLNQKVRLAIAFVILCACTVLILYTGPGFNFALQVLLSCILLFILFAVIT